MDELQDPGPDRAFLRNALEAAIRIGVVALLAAWCFTIVRPFAVAGVWGIIIAIAVHPLYQRLCNWLRGRSKLAAALTALLLLLLLLVPTVMLSRTAYEGTAMVAERLRQGSLVVPPPPAAVAGWPLVGEPLTKFWTLASENLSEALRQVAPQAKAASRWLLGMAAGAGFALLQFILAIAIAGVLLAHHEGGHHLAGAVARRLAGRRGEEFADLAGATVRSVTRGILGVAIIQSLLAGLGFLVAGVPGAGLWALLCLILAVLQIGPGLVLIGVIAYVFATASTATAVIFLVWNVFVGLIDNVLKPLLLGRGVNVPMVVIFLGAIGGFLSMGIIGLFVGSIVLVLGYTILLTWLGEGGERPVEGEGG